jgi:hypothetical protein
MPRRISTPSKQTIRALVGLAALAIMLGTTWPSSPCYGQSNTTAIDARAAAAGIRKLPGKRLTLYTDLSGPEIDVLPAVFEQAFPQWCTYFHVDENRNADWHMTGFLIKDKKRFVETGLLPKDLPPFEHAYSRDHDLWLYEQPSDYYRRHLLVHEGTHGFMFSMLGSCGPFWYMEGMAELLATHRWHGGRLTLGYMPRNREETPEWGRVRIIQDAVAARKAMRLQAVIDSPSTGEGDTASYAWRWATATLLDRHPRYQQRFRQLIPYVNEPDFNQRFHKLFEADWQALCEEWQLMVVNLEYGYDVARSAIDFTPGKPLQASPRPLGEGQGVRAGGAPNESASPSPPKATATVVADRGWQNSGLRLEAGTTYELTASGRYQIAKQPKRGPSSHNPAAQSSANSHKDSSGKAQATAEDAVWWCEPGGVTIRYYRGHPLGMLLAAVRPDNPKPGSTTALLHSTAIGLGATLTPKESGTLFLKVNDSAAELDDNAGELKVEIRPVAK